MFLSMGKSPLKNLNSPLERHESTEEWLEFQEKPDQLISKLVRAEFWFFMQSFRHKQERAINSREGLSVKNAFMYSHHGLPVSW